MVVAVLLPILARWQVSGTLQLRAQEGGAGWAGQH
jgi:hypothetical protein